MQTVWNQNVGPDLDPESLTLIVFQREIYEIVNFKQSQQTTTKTWKLPSMHRAKEYKFLKSTIWLEYQERLVVSLSSYNG